MAGSKAALLVATAEYGDPAFRRLRTPGHDVEALRGVLEDPAIGGFDVRALVNQPGQVVEEEIEGFFADRKPDDLLVLYLSCHGVKDQDGRLYFAATDTKLRRLAASGISSTFVNEQMGNSRSKRVVLLLDCCYSGAFARGFAPRGGEGVELKERLQGRGRVVITASSAMEYAFEAGQLTSDSAQPSVFTTAVVQGLHSGEADRDGDGRVSVDELYDFVFDQVREATPDQRPGIFSDIQGALYIAQNPNPPARVERLALTLGPPLVQGGHTGRLVATASNDGTTHLDLTLRAQVPEGGVEGRVEPARLVLEPGTGAIAEVRISPARPLTGGVRRHTVQVQANSTQGRRWEATAVFEQTPLLGRRHLLLLGGGLAALALAIMLLLFLPRDGGDGEQPSALPGAILSVRGSIESPGAQDTYTFTASAGQRVLFDARDCASGGRLVWTLRQPDDEPLFENETVCDADSPADLRRTLPQAGNYRLIVSGADGATGTYRVTLWPVLAPQQFSVAIGGTIAAGRPAPGAGNIESPGAQDDYTFTADKPQRVYLDVRECASNGSLVWRLLRPDEELVFDNETMCSGGTRGDQEDVRLPQAGNYRLAVSGNDSATGTYRVTLWPVPAPQQFSVAIGGTIAPGRPGPGAGNIEKPRAQDHYTFTASKGQRIYLDTTECASSGILVWTLLRPNKEPLLQNESMCSGGSPSDQADVTLPQAGKYRLIVSGGEAATGTYRVKVHSR
jgi:Caspase domain